MVTKAVLTILGVLCCQLLMAQTYGGGADQNDLSFGFSFQYISQDFKIIKKPDWQTPRVDPETGKDLTSPLTSISSKSTPGFTVGFITRYSLTDHLEVRTTPALVFADRSISYTYQNPNENTTRAISTTMVDLPLLLKLKSDRIKNFRVYLVGGVKYDYGLSRGKGDENELPLQRKIKNARGFASYEGGIGFDLYFEYFKLSPELKVGNSFRNILISENHPFSDPINKLFLHSIMFTLHFE